MSPDDTKDTTSARGWSRGKKVIAGLLGLGGAIATLQGAVGGVSSAWNWIQKEPAPEVLETEFDRTPHAGLEFWQGQQLAPMRSRDGTQDVIRVALKPAPFVIRAPKLPSDTAIQI